MSHNSHISKLILISHLFFLITSCKDGKGNAVSLPFSNQITQESPSMSSSAIDNDHDLIPDQLEPNRTHLSDFPILKFMKTNRHSIKEIVSIVRDYQFKGDIRSKQNILNSAQSLSLNTPVLEQLQTLQLKFSEHPLFDKFSNIQFNFFIERGNKQVEITSLTKYQTTREAQNQLSLEFELSKKIAQTISSRENTRLRIELVDYTVHFKNKKSINWQQHLAHKNLKLWHIYDGKSFQTKILSLKDNSAQYAQLEFDKMIEFNEKNEVTYFLGLHNQIISYRWKDLKNSHYRSWHQIQTEKALYSYYLSGNEIFKNAAKITELTLANGKMRDLNYTLSKLGPGDEVLIEIKPQTHYYSQALEKRTHGGCIYDYLDYQQHQKAFSINSTSTPQVYFSDSFSDYDIASLNTSPILEKKMTDAGIKLHFFIPDNFPEQSLTIKTEYDQSSEKVGLYKVSNCGNSSGFTSPEEIPDSYYIFIERPFLKRRFEQIYNSYTYRFKIKLFER